MERGHAVGLVDSWRRQPPSLRVLRAFLGVTFAYAGAQKLADPGYLSSSSSTYIGTQLRGFASGSPVSWLLHPLVQHAVAAGVAVALIEIAIGIGTLVDFLPLTSALAGCSVSVVLWLSATWHVHPYFLGSDSIYAIAWGAYALSIWERRRSEARPTAPQGIAEHSSAIDRRSFIRSGVFAAGVLALGGLARVLRGPLKTTSPVAAAGSASPSVPAGPSTAAVTGKPIVALDKLEVGRPVGFTGPSGEPAVLFRLDNDEVVAYSRICTHAGCTVGYDSSSDLLVCPCHLAKFAPADGARAVSGPTNIPLPEIAIAVDRSTGTVVLPRSG
jgi:thiosulfate dehydrogenase [quinone] large subunit